MKKRLIWIAPLALVALTAFIVLGGVIVQQLWNWLLPMLFGFRQITFWQALGILVLCRILFGGFRLRGGSRPGGLIRRRMSERWERMTPEERDRFRQGMCGKWSTGAASPGNPGQQSS